MEFGMKKIHYKQSVLKAEKLMSKIDSPIFPNELVELQALLSQHDVPNLKRTSQLISQNPYLAAELVSLANIPVFNPKLVKINDLDAAIFQLGINHIKSYIFSISLNQSFLEKGYQGLSQHSQNIALIISAIARATKVIHQSEAYFLGLVHDIGSFAIQQIDSNYGMVFEGKNLNSMVSSQKESNRYGTSHSALGYVMSKALQLPKEISLTILFHHEPDIEIINNPRVQRNVALLELSHLIRIQQEYGTDGLQMEQTELFERCCRVLNMSSVEIDEVHKELSHFDESLFP